MSCRRLLALSAAAIVLLSGCAMQSGPGSGSAPSATATATPTPAASSEPASDSYPPAPPPAIDPEDMPPSDAVGQSRADAWLAGVLVPPGAVAVDERPVDAGGLSSQHTAWWCSPMGLATGYWRVPGMGVIETANWLGANPGPGLVSTLAEPYVGDVEVDAASLGHVPERAALEGIGFTVVAVDDGSVVRAEVGAFGDSTVCPTLPPGVALGGPGQG